MRRGFHLLWAVHLGLLLLAPKLLQERGFPEALHSWRKQQPAVVQRPTELLMSPVLDLCSLAAVPSVWLPQVSRHGTTPTQRPLPAPVLLQRKDFRGISGITKAAACSDVQAEWHAGAARGWCTPRFCVTASVRQQDHLLHGLRRRSTASGQSRAQPAPAKGG